MNLETTYLGLRVPTPIVAGAGPLTSRLDSVRQLAAAGAGAIVLRSLFEEQLQAETQLLDDSLAAQSLMHSEVSAFLTAGIGMRYGSRDYLQLVRDCRAAVNVPIIASINCLSTEWWREFAREVETAGADALELNLALLPAAPSETGAHVESRYVEVVRAARKAVTLPIVVKIGPWFSALPEFLVRLQQAGANGFHLFNRYYQPTIDVESMEVVGTRPWSQPAEQHLALRWIAMLSGRVRADLAAGTGIHSGTDVARMLLAGAQVVHSVTALLQNGPGHVRVQCQELETWMTRHSFASLAEYRGALSEARNPDRQRFERLQYMKTLTSSGN